MDELVLFSAAIRVIGLLSMGRGLYDLIYAALDALQLTGKSVAANVPFQDFVFGVFYLALGMYLLRGAPYIVNLAFPETILTNDDSQDSDKESKNGD